MIIHVPPQLAANLQAWAAKEGFEDVEGYAIAVLARRVGDGTPMPLSAAEKDSVNTLMTRAVAGGRPTDLTEADWALIRRFVRDPSNRPRLPDDPEQLDAMVEAALQPGKVSPCDDTTFEHLHQWLEAFIDSSKPDARHE